MSPSNLKSKLVIYHSGLNAIRHLWWYLPPLNKRQIHWFFTCNFLIDGEFLFQWISRFKNFSRPTMPGNMATWCEGLTHLKRPWCWERLKAGGEGGNRGWDGWMASPTQWTWVWVNSGSWWWWTGRPGMLQSIGLQRVGHDSATELNWCLVKLILNLQIASINWPQRIFQENKIVFLSTLKIL